ncbi:MAG: hypothetical protein RLN96_03295, partial [Pseudomonadales bacterium]
VDYRFNLEGSESDCSTDSNLEFYVGPAVVAASNAERMYFGYEGNRYQSFTSSLRQVASGPEPSTLVL